jgi:hypothetical protein
MHRSPGFAVAYRQNGSIPTTAGPTPVAGCPLSRLRGRVGIGKLVLPRAAHGGQDTALAGRGGSPVAHVPPPGLSPAGCIPAGRMLCPVRRVNALRGDRGGADHIIDREIRLLSALVKKHTKLNKYGAC